jgi:AraC-like DNA-binding protein
LVLLKDNRHLTRNHCLSIVNDLDLPGGGSQMRHLLRKIVRRISLFHSWLLSYGLIIVIGLVSSGILYLQASSIIGDEINKANLALLKQVQQDMDTRMNEMERLSMQLFLNSRLEVLIHASPPLSESQQYSIYQIVQDFKAYGATNNFIRGFYVYIPQIGQAIASDGAYTNKKVYELFHSNNKFEYADWMKMVETPHSRAFIPLSNLNAVEGNRTFGYIQSFPLGSKNLAQATLVVLVDETRIQEMLRNIEWLHPGMLLIADGNDQIVTSTQYDIDTASLDLARMKGSGLFYQEISGKEMAVSYITSNSMGWKYVAIVPTSTFFNKLTLIRRIAIVSMILCLLLSGLAALYFAKRNYNPIRGLIGLFPNKETPKHDIDEQGSSHNEYQVIREMIASTLHEKTKIREELNEHTAAVKASFLARLIRGRYSAHIPLHDSLSTFNMHFMSEYFAVMIFYVEDYGKLANNGSNQNDEQEELASFILKNVMEELTGDVHQGWLTEVDQLLVCIVNLNKDAGTGTRNDLVLMANKAQIFVQEKFGIRFTVAVGQTNPTIKGISESYGQALEALEHKFVMGGGKVILFEDIEAPKNNYYYPIEKEQQFMSSIKVGDLANSQAIFNEIFDRNLQSAHLSIQMVKCLIFDMASTVVKTLDELGLSGEGQFLEDVNPVDRLINCENVFQMKEQMSNILELVCQYVNGKKKSHNTGLKESIEVYITTHYSDFNLSISLIADHLNMNASYLSRFYKEQAGESLVEFINKTRIEAAKKMLKNPTLTMSHIAEQVGYSSNIALIRAFKRYVGMTPGKYKELLS